jgi:glycosyltransferase involved in cell wall biosynthesis
VAAEKQTGWANTVAEAMASGIPVVSTRSGTLDLIIDKETGIFVNRNIRSISRGIEKLINSYELRLHLAVNAREHVKQFDWQILATKIIKWYQEQEDQASFR